MANQSIRAAFDRMWQHVVAKLGDKANVDHNHNDMYYTESEVDSKISAVNTNITNITNGSVIVKEAEHATNADIATSANTATSATKATQDGNGKVISSTYETKVDAQTKLDESKAYTDTTVANLVNSAPETLDTLGELATAFEENKDVVEALDTAITNKADKEHTHHWNDLEDRPFYANDSSFRDRFVPSAYEEVDSNLLKVISSNSAIREIKNSIGIDINVPTDDYVLGKKLDIIITNEKQEEKVVSIDNPYYIVGVTDNGYPYLRFCHKDKMPIYEYRIEENDLVYHYVYNYFAIGAISSYGISSSEWGYNPSTGVWLGTEYVFKFTVENVVKLDEKYIPEIISRTGHTHLWNDLEDRPFYRVSFDELDCVYDPNNANNVVNTNGEKIWYLGDPISGNERSRYITDSNGRIYKVPFNRVSSYRYKATFNLTGGNEITVYNILLASGGTIDGITFPSGGTYATAPLFEDGLFITKIEYANYYTLYENYIPDSIARTVDVDEKIVTVEEKLNNYYLKTEADNLHTEIEEYVDSIIPTSEDITLMLADMDVIEPMLDEEGSVLVDENGAILV